MFNRENKSILSKTDNFQHLVETMAPLSGFNNYKRREIYRSLVYNAIETMPSSLQDTLTMHYLQGLGIGEIARRCGIHRTTVTRRLALAKRKIQQLLILFENSSSFPS